MGPAGQGDPMGGPPPEGKMGPPPGDMGQPPGDLWLVPLLDMRRHL